MIKNLSKLLLGACSLLVFFGCIQSHPSSENTNSQKVPAPTATKDPRYQLLRRKSELQDQSCCGNEEVPSPSAAEKKRFLSRSLGTVEQGPVSVTTFEVTNEGKEVIKFKQPVEVSLPCCVVAKLSTEEIKPGETAKLSVKFETTRRPGNFDLFVILFPDQNGLSAQRFHLTGVVRPAFRVSPDPVSFKESGTIEVEISGEDLNKKFKVTNLQTNTPHLNIQKSEKSTDERLVYNLVWDGELFKMAEGEAPAVYIFTDSKIFDWYPILVENEQERLFD